MSNDDTFGAGRSEPDMGGQDSTDVPRLERVATRVLARVAAACGAPDDQASLARILAQLEAPTGSDVSAPEYLDWLARAGVGLGLRTSLASARVLDALDVLRSGQALVSTSSDGRRWFFLECGRADRVFVTTYTDHTDASQEPVDEVTERVSDSQLCEHLDAEPEEVLTWLVADPATPQDSAVSDGGNHEPLTPFRRLIRLFEPDRGDILVTVMFAVVIGILMLATPIAVQAIVNSAAVGGSNQQLIALALVLALALGFAATLTGIQTWVVELIQRRIFVRMVADVAARLPRVELSTYDEGHGQERVNRFFDVLTIQKAAAKLLIDSLGVLLSIATGLAVLAFYHPLLLAFDAVLLVAIALIVLGPLRRGQRTAIAESSAKYDVVAWLEEIARCPYTFKVGGAEQWIFERSDSLSRGWLESRRAHFRTLLFQISGGLALQVLASVALLGIGGFLVIHGSLSLGQLVAAELIVTAVVVSVAKMGKHLETWYDLMAAVHKVGVLLDLPIEERGGEAPPNSKHDRAGELEVTDLAWQNGRGQTLSSGLSFRLAAGQSIAILGPSGSGKTVLLDLLWRLRRPAAGAIRLDGRDLRDLSLDAIRRDIAIVSGVETVHGTIRENVRLRRPFVSGDDVRRAIERVGLRETIENLPDGLNTVLHPSSRMLTQNEQERLMLARAIAGTPRVLIVDALFDDFETTERRRLFDLLLSNDAPWSLLVVSRDAEMHARVDGLVHLRRGAPAKFVQVVKPDASDSNLDADSPGPPCR